MVGGGPVGRRRGGIAGAHTAALEPARIALLAPQPAAGAAAPRRRAGPARVGACRAPASTCSARRRLGAARCRPRCAPTSACASGMNRLPADGADDAGLRCRRDRRAGPGRHRRESRSCTAAALAALPGGRRHACIGNRRCQSLHVAAGAVTLQLGDGASAHAPGRGRRRRPLQRARAARASPCARTTTASGHRRDHRHRAAAPAHGLATLPAHRTAGAAAAVRRLRVDRLVGRRSAGGANCCAATAKNSRRLDDGLRPRAGRDTPAQRTRRHSRCARWPRSDYVAARAARWSAMPRSRCIRWRGRASTRPARRGGAVRSRRRGRAANARTGRRCASCAATSSSA